MKIINNIRYNIKSVVKVTDLHAKTSYVPEVEGRDLIFDLNGRCIKATKK